MKFSYSRLKEMANFKDSPRELAEFLTLRAFEVEKTEKIGGDFALEIKLPVNRFADASGHKGMAKEISALKNLPFKKGTRRLKLKEDSERRTSDFIGVKIENAEDCPRYAARMIENIKVKPSPPWLKKILETCGLQSVNNAVDAANFIMLETGQPLHIFDFAKLSGRGKTREIAVRRAKKGEKIVSLDGKEYRLSPETLVIADCRKPLAIAGIKGGENSGVDENTEKIVLESANFSAELINGASKILGLKTDASLRFGAGLDPNQAGTAIDALAALIQDVAGGIVLKNRIDVYPRPQKNVLISFRPAYADKVIGKNLPVKFYRGVFMRLGWKIKRSEKERFLLEPPTARKDAQTEEDVVEEAARVLGYENIAPKMPETEIIAAEENAELALEEKIGNYLAGAGFNESLLYEFTGEEEMAHFFLEPFSAAEILNPASPAMKYLVPRVLLKYAVSAAENARNFKDVKIFGIAKSFAKNGSVAGRGAVAERKDLVIVLAGNGINAEEGFYRLKGVIDGLMESLGIDDLWYDDAAGEAKKTAEFRMFHPYRFAEIKIGSGKIGNMGELHPEAAKNIKTKARVFCAEINFEKLASFAASETEFRRIAKYPAALRDVSVLAPYETKTEEVLNVIENAGGELLADTDLFDYFQDEKMRGKGEKSLAFRLMFQSPERTLRDEEINAIVAKIISALEEKGWEVRK